MSLTNIVDTLWTPGPSSVPAKFSGTLDITWPTMLAADGHVIPTGHIEVKVRGGALNIWLEPNDTATPTGGYYIIRYALTNGLNAIEYWTVPTSGSPIALDSVRTIAPPFTSPTGCFCGGAGAASGEAEQFTFGFPDDGVGTNKPGYYLPIVVGGQPFTGYITTVGGPTSADTVLDVLFTVNDGSTWTSIFPSGLANKIVIPNLTPAARATAIGGFKTPQLLPAGCVLRVDSLQSGGATFITGVIRYQ